MGTSGLEYTGARHPTNFSLGHGESSLSFPDQCRIPTPFFLVFYDRFSFAYFGSFADTRRAIFWGI